MGEPSQEARERASRVTLLLLDVDGVMTDGRLYLSPGGHESRAFHVRDGQGVRLGQRGGLIFGIVSGREARVVSERAAELYITEVHQGIRDKVECVEAMLSRLDLPLERVAFVGDDLADVAVMKKVGFAAAPSDAIPEARDVAHFVTDRPGGDGAVREVVDLVLRASGKWDQVVERFLR
jgi:3-deoxy-D-manno-octulosonate 8-phosphate phosphatase (KDO 8-P phosphatase)